MVFFEKIYINRVFKTSFKHLPIVQLKYQGCCPCYELIIKEGEYFKELIQRSFKPGWLLVVISTDCKHWVLGIDHWDAWGNPAWTKNWGGKRQESPVRGRNLPASSNVICHHLVISSTAHDPEIHEYRDRWITEMFPDPRPCATLSPGHPRAGESGGTRPAQTEPWQPKTSTLHDLCHVHSQTPLLSTNLIQNVICSKTLVWGLCDWNLWVSISPCSSWWPGSHNYVSRFWLSYDT